MKKLNKPLMNQGMTNKTLSKSPKMLMFDYHAKSYDGKTVSGQISANNMSLARHGYANKVFIISI